MADKIVKFIGPPGTGKTHTLLQQIAIDADRYGPKAVGAVSLTRAALHEIRLRISKELNIHHDDIPHIQTMHSHCFRLLQLSRDKVADTPKWVREFNLFEGGRWKITEGNAGADLEDVLIAGTETFGVDTATLNNDILRSLANLHRQQLIPQDKWHTRILEWFNAWRRFMRETDLIDYTGMMEKVHERGWTLPIKVLHIDEGQDLSPLAHALAHQFGEVCSTVSWYGDSNQCQPAGEIVQTIKGPKDIKDIDPNIDQLYSYARCDGRIYGSCRGGKSFKKASHLYSGKIYTVQCGDRISKSTYNHRWLAKWRMEARDTGYNVVYLMEKNGWFRIGWCQLFNTIGRLHLTIRGNLEKAERIWILKLVDNKPDGSFYESLFAAQYGIPTILFKQVVGGSAAPYYTDAFIEKFFSMLDPVEQRSRVERLLKDCGKYFNCPIYDRDQAGTQTSSCIMEVHACNLIPELMSLVITDNLKTVEHETLDSITTTDVENEPVYGLDVDKYHTYITTSGIVTHNSIYRFAGAMPENFMDLPHTDEVILDQSYRCSPGIVNYANSVISKCRRWEQADYKPCMSYGEGKRYFLSEPDLSLPGTHMILSRAKYQVEPWIAWLIANGIPYYNPYRKDALMWNPCDTQIFRALRTHQALTAGEDVPLGDFLIMLKHTQAKHCFNARGGKKDADTMAKEAIAQKRLTLSIIDMDQMSFNPAFLEGQKGQGAWQSAQDFFLIKENNASELLKQMIARDTLTERPRVIVGTQHSIKGGSADYVWIDPAWPGRVRQNVIGKAGTQDYDDEVRLAYVAITRARRGVGIVHPKRGFDDGCIY